MKLNKIFKKCPKVTILLIIKISREEKLWSLYLLWNDPNQT